MRSGVPQKDVWKIMNKINFALEGTGYQAYMYDNTEEYWLKVYVENENPFFQEKEKKRKVVEKNG